MLHPVNNSCSLQRWDHRVKSQSAQYTLGVGRREKGGGGGGKRWSHAPIKKNRRGRERKHTWQTCHEMSEHEQGWPKTTLQSLGSSGSKSCSVTWRLINHLCVHVCFTEFPKRSEAQKTKNDTNRLSTDRNQNEVTDMGRDSIGRGANNYVWEKPRSTKCPYTTLLPGMILISLSFE